MKTFLAILLLAGTAYGQTPTPVPDDYYFEVKVKKELPACRQAIFQPVQSRLLIPLSMIASVAGDTNNKVYINWAMAWDSTPAQRQAALDYLDAQLIARCGEGYTGYKVKAKGEKIKTAKDIAKDGG